MIKLAPLQQLKFYLILKDYSRHIAPHPVLVFFKKFIEQFVVTAGGSLTICARSKIYIPIPTRLKIVGPETVPPGRKFSCVIF